MPGPPEHALLRVLTLGMSIGFMYLLCFSFSRSLSVSLCLPPSLLPHPMWAVITGFPPPSQPSPPPQEARGMPTVAGCGRHGPDAGTGLEVCIYVHPGILSLPGPEGVGKNQKVLVSPPAELW